MNIALIGYGKMGRMIESAALERGHRIVVLVDPFATPPASSQAQLFRSVGKRRIPIPSRCGHRIHGAQNRSDQYSGAHSKGPSNVVGSTGWSAQLGYGRSRRSPRRGVPSYGPPIFALGSRFLPFGRLRRPDDRPLRGDTTWGAGRPIISKKSAYAPREPPRNWWAGSSEK